MKPDENPLRTRTDETGEYERSQGQLGAYARDADLQVALRGLATLTTADRSLDEFLAAVAAWVTYAIPGADGAAVTLVASAAGGHRFGSSSNFVDEIHLLQDEILHEGPHITCLQTQAPVVSGSLDTDGRWLRFGRGVVAALGVRSSVSYPLVISGKMIGVVDAYARARDAFDEHAALLGARFAEPAAVAVYNARQLRGAQDVAKHLQRSLTHHAVIDQAVGIVRSHTGASVEEALARLAHVSATDEISLQAVAHRMVELSVQRSRMLRP